LAKKSITDDRSKLRADAEARYARDPPETASSPPTIAVLHELQVHQIELEMQNEELRRAQLALGEEHDRYVDLYDFAPVGYLTLDAKGVVVQVNLTGAALLGVDRKQLVGRRFAGFVAARDAERWHLFLATLVQSGEHQPCRLSLQRGDGSTLAGHVSGQRQAQGDEVRIVLTDVSASERLEQSLRESKALLTLFIEHAPAAIAMFDQDMRYLAVSHRWLTDYRLQERDLRGRSHYEVFPEIPERWKEIHRRCLAGAVEKCDRDPFPRADGGTEWVRWEIHPWRSAGGKVGGLVMFTEVITERLNLQAQLAVASRLASLGTLVAGVAHEINNPLTAGLADQGLALEVLQEVRESLDGETPIDRKEKVQAIDGVVEALEEAQEAGQRIARIVKDLALFGRPGGKRTRVRLVDMVERAMRWLPAALYRSATIQVQNGGAPDVMASAGQIEQVVVNLVTNAAKATRAGDRGSIVIRIGPGEPGMARLDVIDEGAGIDPVILEQVFDPFFTTRPLGSGKGVGLGLAICHAIVTAHGGKITVSSVLGKGSTFRVELPAAVAEA